MSRRRLHVFDRDSEPIARRIAVGLSKIGLAMKQEAFSSAGGSGLSPTQAQILTMLAAAGARASELATRLAVSLPTVSDSVRALVDKGLVDKQVDDSDRRAARLVLTEAGKKKAAVAAGWPDFLASAVDAMEPSEQEVFLAGLVKMIRTLQERGQIPIARMCTTCTHFRPNAHDDARTPHHCAFVDAPMGDRHLRLDCNEHQTRLI